MKKFSILLIVALLAVAALSACTPETIVETVIVEVEGETIVETVEVEVPVEVEKEVVVTQEVEVEVPANPRPWLSLPACSARPVSRNFSSMR